MKITDELIRNCCSKTILERGSEYFREGRVHMRKREENLINAVVDDDRLYNVQIKSDGKRVTDYFCTCPYYETMNSACKHIASVLMQHRAEIEEGAGYHDENDKLAQTVCGEYAENNVQKQTVVLRFILYISSAPDNKVSYGMSIETDSRGTVLQGIENFLDCYINKNKFYFSKRCFYDPASTVFIPQQRTILNILAENYENRSSSAEHYVKAAYITMFGEQSAKRIFPLLNTVDYKIVIDSIRLGSVRILEEDPDIMIDAAAAGEEITLTVSQRGRALTQDGEWFAYEQTIYHTTPSWRRYYMPIYRAIFANDRTQISFRGDNIMLFAKHVLPEIRQKNGVVLHGVDELIVDEEPVFKVYFDAAAGGISAVVIAKYGNISLKLPSANEDGKRIVVRNYQKENDILEFFLGFELSNGSYTCYYNSDIYNFLTQKIPLLEKKAEIFASESFRNISVKKDISLKAYVSYNYNIDLFEAGYESDLTPEQIIQILEAVKLKKRFYRLTDGSFIDLEKNTKGTLLSLLSQLDFCQEELINGKKIIEEKYALYLNAIDDVSKDEGFRRYMEEIKSVKPNIPDGLETVLRNYQYDGLQWLKQLSMLGLGGILADDMGLGKTLQALAYAHGEEKSAPVIIISPSSLTYNWMGEIKRFIPDAKAVIIEGVREERERLIKTIPEYEFIITSYPLLRRDIGLYKKTVFSYCFIDEAQYIKNYKTMNSQCVKKINARLRFALTGTPIENSVMELWSIFDFVMPGYLGTASEFREKYEQPLIKDSDSDQNKLLKAKIRPFILRRMKRDVLDELPEKIENTIYADMTVEQKRVYSSYLSLARDQTRMLLGEGGRNRMQILTLIMRLRQICCHPSLFDEEYKKDSGKLDLLMELIENAIESGHRVLVFSQFVDMLGIIRKRLREKSVPSFYLDGGTPAYERAEAADRFNAGERDVFLISLKAGGTGLNLTGADMVIHYEPWWNPAVVEQASDRAYRIGQTRAVQVIKLASRGTIEEKILKLQQLKKNLADDIISANANAFKNLSDEEILGLFE